jgi:hypothetical protein
LKSGRAAGSFGALALGNDIAGCAGGLWEVVTSFVEVTELVPIESAVEFVPAESECLEPGQTKSEGFLGAGAKRRGAGPMLAR